MTQAFLDFDQFRLFSGLTQANLEEIARMTRMSKVKKGRSIYQTGEQAAFVYLLMGGWVKALRSDVGEREVILNILGSGEIFGEECVLGEDPYDTTVVALEDLLIGAIAKVDFVRYLSGHEHLALGFARLLNYRVQKTQQHVAELVLHTVPSRLARLLLTYYSTTPGATDCLSGCVRLTHQEMANHIGCSRETVSTAIGRFKTNGLVHFPRPGITRVDEKGLSRLLRESPNSYTAPPPSRRAVLPFQHGLSMSASTLARRVSLQASPARVHGPAAR